MRLCGRAGPGPHVEDDHRGEGRPALRALVGHRWPDRRGGALPGRHGDRWPRVEGGTGPRRRATDAAVRHGAGRAGGRCPGRGPGTGRDHGRWPLRHPRARARGVPYRRLRVEGTRVPVPAVLGRDFRPRTDRTVRCPYRPVDEAPGCPSGPRPRARRGPGPALGPHGGDHRRGSLTWSGPLAAPTSEVSSQPAWSPL